MGSRHLPLLYLLFLSYAGNLTASPDCSSLLRLKASFTSSLLPSWGPRPSTDCCTWDGVTCDGLTGRITGLDLSNRSIVSSAIGPSLFNLTSLRTLNLAYNRFDEIPIPRNFRSLRNLTHLNLSNSGFTGQIPIEIAGLSNLVSLDLSTFYLNVGPTLSLKLESPNLAALVRTLTSLRELYLDGVNVSDTEWCQALASSVPGLTSLSLTACSITGPIDSSLSRIANLSVIRLDQNQLNCTVPDFFASFASLRVLRLSFCGLRGEFPKHVFALERLADVDLSSNPLLSGSFPDFPEGSGIEKLVVRETNFSGQLPDSIGKMKLLSKLDLSSCRFSGRIPASIANLTKLVALDLSANRFTGTIPLVVPSGISDLNFAHNLLNESIPSSLGTLRNLTNLDLSNNSLSGLVPASLFALPSLLQLVLSQNQLSGSIGPFNASDQLSIIDLSSNKLSGEIPMSVFNLSAMKILTLASNNLSGVVDLDWFRDLRNLSSLDLSYNRLSVRGGGDGNSSLLPFPVISTLKLVSCNLTEVPSFLKSQDHITNLDLSNNTIGGPIPSWIWTRTSLAYLNLSMNAFSSVEGPPPNFSAGSSISIDLHSNWLQGPIPLPPSNPIILDYSNNLFTLIPSNFSLYLSFTVFFSLSKNRLKGEIPLWICNATYLKVLDFSDNNLSGPIPPCIFQAGNDLRVLNLRNNNLRSTIPRNISEGCVLKTINLNSNLLEGEVPSSLANCTTLEVLDLGNNRIVGSFPSWLGSVSSLRVLVLRSNGLHGPIGPTWIYNATNYAFPLLQILDLSSNQLSGNLPPESFKILKGMATSSAHNWSTVEFKYMQFMPYYQDTVTVRIKGLDLALEKILTVFTSIDLSNNNFTGEIPEEIGNLRSLLVLNLSRNALTGSIPQSIGNLTQLESLDLSANLLSGEIPPGLTSLYFLSSLNLSRNKLVGRIPTGSQLATFLNSSYEDNAGLCGIPLSKQCNPPSAETPYTKSTAEETPYTKSTAEVNWQFIFAGFGYGGGLAAVFGFLMVSDTGKKRFERGVDRMLWAVVPSWIWRMCDYCFGDRRVRDEEGDAVEAERWPSRKFCVFCTQLKLYGDRLVLLHNEECQCSLK